MLASDRLDNVIVQNQSYRSCKERKRKKRKKREEKKEEKKREKKHTHTKKQQR